MTLALADVFDEDGQIDLPRQKVGRPKSFGSQSGLFLSDPDVPKDSGLKSWWLEPGDHESFSKRAEEERPRMSKSKFGRLVATLSESA